MWWWQQTQCRHRASDAQAPARAQQPVQALKLVRGLVLRAEPLEPRRAELRAWLVEPTGAVPVPVPAVEGPGRASDQALALIPSVRCHPTRQSPHHPMPARCRARVRNRCCSPRPSRGRRNRPRQRRGPALPQIVAYGTIPQKRVARSRSATTRRPVAPRQVGPSPWPSPAPPPMPRARRPSHHDTPHRPSSSAPRRPPAPA
jgi:hypothetical protein